MATVQPFAGTHYNPDHVKLGGVLAPPYDVISDAKRDELYGRDLRNIVRIDYGATFPDDVEGVDDRYTRAASFLASWHDLDVLVRDDHDGFYVRDIHSIARNFLAVHLHQQAGLAQLAHDRQFREPGHL